MIPRGGPGFDPRVFLFFSVGGGVLFFFAESGVLFFFLSELHVHFAGCHILLLVQYFWCYHGRFKRGGGGGGGRMRRYNLKLKILWCEYLWVATSPCGGVWGPLPRKFRNMKCSRGDSRPT